MMVSFPSYLAKVRPSERRAGKSRSLLGRICYRVFSIAQVARAVCQVVSNTLTDERGADAEAHGSGVHTAIDREQFRAFVLSSGEVESIVRFRPAERASDVEGALIARRVIDEADVQSNGDGNETP